MSLGKKTVALLTVLVLAVGAVGIVVWDRD
jgi:hypothetical protein